MKRDVLLASHTDVRVVSTLTRPLTNLRIFRTGSLMSPHGNRSGTSNSQGKVVARPQHSPRSWLRVPSHVNDNHCVNSVTGQKNSVCVTGQTGFNPTPVVARDKKVTIDLNVDFCVANAHIVTGLPQRKGVNPNCCQMYTEIKYVKNVYCVGHLSSANLVTNAPPVVTPPPVGARLHKCWEKWEALGASPKVVTTLRDGYTLPFRLRPNLTRSPTVISNYQNPTRQANLLEALSTGKQWNR